MNSTKGRVRYQQLVGIRKRGLKAERMCWLGDLGYELGAMARNLGHARADDTANETKNVSHTTPYKL